MWGSEQILERIKLAGFDERAAEEDSPSILMRFKRHLKITSGQLDTAPLIDVVFLLMIYFMLTSSFIMQPGIKIKLPTALTTESIEKKQFIISIAADGSIFYQEQSVTLKMLKNILEIESKQNPDIVLIIKGDYYATHGKVVEVMDLAKVAGVSHLAIATQPVEEK